MPVITNPQHALTLVVPGLDPLPLVEDEATALAERGYALSVLADDTDWGNPQPIVERITSWLRDGWLAAIEGWEDRDLTVRVKITATTARGLDLGEQALMSRLGRPAELVWQGPDLAGDPVVFEVTTSHLEQALDDMALLRQERSYLIRFTALPWVRSTKLTTISIPAPSTPAPTVTTIDDCTSLSGWSGWPTNTVALDSGSVVSSQLVPPDTRDSILQLERTGLSVSMSGSPFLRVAYALHPNGTTFRPMEFRVNGIKKTPVVIQPDGTGVVAWYDCTGMTLASVRMQVSVDNPRAYSISPDIAIADISRSTAPRDGGVTGRQSSRTVEIAGSVRTPASLAIQSAAGTLGLGQVLIHVRDLAASPMTPNLRAKRTTGPTATADSVTVSGLRSDLTQLHVFTLPASQIGTGRYVLYAMVRATPSAGVRTITWSARWKMGSATSSDLASGSATALLQGADAAGFPWSLVRLGNVPLPLRGMGPAGSVLIRMQADTACEIDEAWACDLTNGRLVVINCGDGPAFAGGPAARLLIDAPTIATGGLPGLRAGTAADDSDLLDMSDLAWSDDVLDFEAGLNGLHIVTTGVTDPDAILSCYARGHSSIVDVA